MLFHLEEDRTVQNKVSDEAGKIVYLPPEAKDVPFLMEELVAWINNPENVDLPAPLKAGIFPYQFLTIHSYMAMEETVEPWLHIFCA